MDGNDPDEISENWATRRIEELESENEKLRQIVEGIEYAPLVVFMKDRENKAFFHNRLDREIIGIDHQNYGQQNEDIFEENVAQKISEIEQQVIDEKILITTEERFKAKNEPYHRTYLTSRGPIIDDNGEFRGIFGTALDISQQKFISEVITDYQQLTSLKHLTRGLTHDFNNILAILLGNISVLKATENEEETREIYEALQKAIARGKSLIATINDYTLDEETNLVDLDINDRLHKLVKKMRERLSGDIRIVFDPSDEELIVEGITEDLENALYHIIQNGADAMNSGGRLNITTTSVDTRDADNRLLDERLWGLPQGRYVKLEIKDQGTGIKDEELDKIFIPFYSTKPRSKRSNFGFGLAITKKVLLENNCFLFVDTKVGEGSIFTIFIPNTPKEFSISSLGRQEIEYN